MSDKRHWWACAVNAPRPEWVGPCDCDLSRPHQSTDADIYVESLPDDASERIYRAVMAQSNPIERSSFGTAEHLRMGLTKNGDGPVLSEDDPDFDHWGCWCGTPGCDKYEGNTDGSHDA